MSVGREGGSTDGRIVYVVVYYINDSGQTFVGVSTTENLNKLVLFLELLIYVINEGLKEKEL